MVCEDPLRASSWAPLAEMEFWRGVRKELRAKEAQELGDVTLVQVERLLLTDKRNMRSRYAA